MNISWACPKCGEGNVSALPHHLSIGDAVAGCASCACRVRFMGDECAPVEIDEWVV